MKGMDYLFLGLGFGAVIYSTYAFRNPSVILRGRKARAWVALIGEEKTIWVGRFIGVPLGILIGILMAYMGASGQASKLSKKPAHATESSSEVGE